MNLEHNNTLSEGGYEFNLITRNRILLEAAYRGSWIVGRVIDSVAEDMTSAGIDVTTNEGEEDLEDLDYEMQRLQILQSIRNGIKWGNLYGGAIGVLQIKGQNLETPFDVSTVGKDQFLGITIYDRWQLNPVMTPVIQEGPEMGLPKFYAIVNNASGLDPTAATATGQLKVHHSRIVRFIGIELPYFQAITEMMWGESVLERLWDRLIAFDSVTMSTANLVERANNRTVGVDGLRQIIAAGGEAMKGLLAQFDMMRSMQTNEGLTLLDKEDTFATSQYTFSGLSDVIIQFGQQVSGSSEIPLVRLFGQSPAGLSATGEADIRMYYDKIKARQEAMLRNPFHVILQVLWRSKFGTEAPADLKFTFTPLWQTSAMDKAAIAKSNAETILGAGEVISRKVQLQELRGQAEETGLFSNITDKDIADAEDEPPPSPDEPTAPGGALSLPKLADISGQEGDPDKSVAPAPDKPEPGKTGDSAMRKIRRWLSKN